MKTFFVFSRAVYFGDSAAVSVRRQARQEAVDFISPEAVLGQSSLEVHSARDPPAPSPTESASSCKGVSPEAVSEVVEDRKTKDSGSLKRQLKL
jgi:hypothetical protein